MMESANRRGLLGFVQMGVPHELLRDVQGADSDMDAVAGIQAIRT